MITIHYCKFKDLKIRIKAMSQNKEALAQIICIGQQHPEFVGAALHTSNTSYYGNESEEYYATISIRGCDTIVTGFRKTEAEVIAELDQAMRAALSQLEMVAA